MAASYFIYPFYEVGIVGSECFKKRNELAKKFLPNIVLFGSSEEENLVILKERFVEGKTLIYICEKGVCQLPVEDVGNAIVKLEE